MCVTSYSNSWCFCQFLIYYTHHLLYLPSCYINTFSEQSLENLSAIMWTRSVLTLILGIIFSADAQNTTRREKQLSVFTGHNYKYFVISTKGSNLSFFFTKFCVSKSRALIIISKLSLEQNFPNFPKKNKKNNRIVSSKIGPIF